MFDLNILKKRREEVIADRNMEMEDFENIFIICHRQLHCFWCFELSVEIFKMK